MDEQHEDPLEVGSRKNFARYVTEHDHGTFTGPLLAHYQQAHQLDDRALADLLDCSEEDLVHLALCGRPRPDQFTEDVSRIAEHVHARVDSLNSLYQEMMTLPPQPKKVYQGRWEKNNWYVTVNGKPLTSIGYHCPDGFAWGYDGSACSELALCLLRDHFQEWYVTRAYLMERGKIWSSAPNCWQWHLGFKSAFVANWGRRDSWEITDVEMSDWIDRNRMPETPADACVQDSHSSEGE